MGAGDDSRAAFDRLIVEAIPSMLRFATRLCGNSSDAEDVVQDALLRAARNWRSFRGEAKVSTWLFRIVINAFRDRHQVLESVGQEIAIADEPLRQIEAEEFGAIVARHVSNLPSRQREVLVLIAYEQMTTSDAATVLGISEQSVRTNLHFARERMREKLAKYVNENARE
jgi:RNA polymerase sigma-70 factor, ECF subfamily